MSETKKKKQIQKKIWLVEAQTKGRKLQVVGRRSSSATPLDLTSEEKNSGKASLEQGNAQPEDFPCRKYKVQSTKYEVQNTKYEIRSTKYEVRNTSYELRNTSQIRVKKKLQRKIRR